MSTPLLRRLPWIFATLVVAVVAHLASVYTLPGLIMSRVLTAMTRDQPYNVVRHGARPNASARFVVRPSPDLLYSSCPYDLSKGPLEVHALVPAGTYWSVSAFDGQTNNFFARNDRQARGGVVDFILIGPDHDKMPLTEGKELVFSPTDKGLILFRTLINDDRRFAEIDSARRHVECSPLTSDQ